MTNRLKKAYRQTNKMIRERLSPATQHHLSQKICTQIQALENYRYAKHIALYQAHRGEVSLDTLWHSAPLQGKYCYFPVMSAQQTLFFLPATPKTHFKRNSWGILEPDVSLESAIPVEDLDIIFLPVVAFDARGTRLGMGKGYYDRTLAHASTTPLLVGVAYQFQHQSFIQPSPWDILLSLTVTEKTIYWNPS